MKILSLFDGMSCAQIAINKLGIKDYTYYASEVDKYAIQVTQDNYPNTIQLGDITKLTDDQIRDLDIDLLVGGSPCQGFSFAGKMKGMTTKCNIEITTLEQYLKLKNEKFEFNGQSYLFWEYIRILRILQEKKPDIKFLLENVKVSKKWLPTLNSAIGVEPIFINSSDFSAQNRPRYYWTNIKIDKWQDNKITIKDICDSAYIKKA